MSTIQPVASVAAQQALATNKTVNAGGNVAAQMAVAVLSLAVDALLDTTNWLMNENSEFLVNENGQVITA